MISIDGYVAYDTGLPQHFFNMKLLGLPECQLRVARWLRHASMGYIVIDSESMIKYSIVLTLGSTYRQLILKKFK